MNLQSYLSAIVSNSVYDEVQQACVNQQLNAQTLLNLCNIITSRITFYTQKNDKYHVYGRAKITSGKSLFGGQGLKKEDIDELYIYGAQLIYSLRTYFTGEEISYQFNTQGLDNNINAIVPQSYILMGLGANKSGIVFAQSLQKELVQLQHLQFARERTQLYQWSTIERLYEVVYGSTSDIAHYKGVPYYSSLKDDMNMYIGWRGKQTSWLYKLDNRFKEINKGWLFEWYNELYENAEEEQLTAIHEQLWRGSIRGVVESNEQDYIRGTSQGDYMRQATKEWIQSKYNNTVIIKLNSIRQIIFDLEAALKVLISEGADSSSAQTKLKDLLNQYFLPQAAQATSDMIKNITNRLMSNSGLTF